MAGALDAGTVDRLPDRTIADGLRTLGFIFFNDDGSCSATGPLGEPLGWFEKVELARGAVVANARGGDG